MRAVVVAPGEGHAVGNVEFLARTADTPRFNLALITIAPRRAGPEAHAHAAEDDAFFMLEGELTFTVDGEDVRARNSTLPTACPSPGATTTARTPTDPPRAGGGCRPGRRRPGA